MEEGGKGEMRHQQDKTPADESRDERKEAEQREIGLVSSRELGPHVGLFSGYGHFRGTNILRLISEGVSH